MTGSFHLIVNPAAGGGRALKSAAEAAGVLDALGIRHQVTRSASLAHARELAAAAAGGGHVAVAVGGDGLTGALAAAVAGQDPDGVLGVIPAGRGNDLARVLAIPAGPEAAVRLLAGGTPRRVDLVGVSIPGQPELAVAGSVYAGLPSVASEIASATRWLTGPAVYPVAALRALAAWTPVSFGLDRAGASPAEFPGYAVVIANIAYFGAGMMVAPPARIDDGALDIVTMRHGPRLAFLRVLVRIRGGTHVALPQVGLDRAAAVTLTMDRALPVAADGEVLPWARPLPAGTPLTVRALPGALRVLAPPAAR
ncbi:MAG TPA: diacylglycerol kinase family protein [Streptosporangiaceae bacterium]|nr:diacylglycerol kinase family protein [Streptosporangiaceae bacterium]